jgi:hypothetical protein
MGIKDDPENECVFTANEINAHCSSLALKFHQPLNAFLVYNSKPTTGLFSFRKVDYLEILNAISRLKSMAFGLDRILLKKKPRKSRKPFLLLNLKIHPYQKTTFLSASLPPSQSL